MDRNNEATNDRVIGVLGLGIQSQDGHVRISKGEQFQIYLGSEESHETMLELCLRLEQELEARGLDMEALSREEFLEILQSL